MKDYIVYYIDEKMGVIMFYWGTADLKIRSFTNAKGWATKLKYNKALQLARSKKEYQICKYEDAPKTIDTWVDAVTTSTERG